jgi:hypothetical protein
VIEVNRKILLTVVALAAVLLTTPYVGMVHAVGGQQKQDFLLTADIYVLADAKTMATDSSNPGARVRVGLTYDTVHNGWSGTLQTYPHNIQIMRATVSFADGSTLEILAVLKIVPNPDTIHISADGHFVAFGTGALKGVHLMGTCDWFKLGYLHTAFRGEVKGWPW